MRVETFYDKFDQLVDAPNAVAKMRELVLQWAVQGRLVRQDTNEEPASKLIREAVHARKKLVAAKVVRDETPDLGFLDHAENGLPVGWVHAPLSVYVGVIMGQSPPSSAYNESGEGLPFYQGKAQFGRLYPTATDWCTEPTKIGEPSDVVISVRAPVGPTNMLREKSCIGRGLASLRSLGGEQMHLLYTLRAFERSIAEMGVGSTFVAISKSDLDEFLIPVPPLAEQKRIVAKVDELMALCDRLETQHQERETRHAALARASLARFADAPTPANLPFLFHPSYAIPTADLRKSILTLAVQGKLVPQDSNDEPAEELAARLERERAGIATEQGVRLPKNVPAITTDNYPHDIPESWQWSRIGHLALVIDYGTSQKADSDSSKVPVYRMGNIVSGRLTDENLKYVDASIDDLPGLYLKTDDILFNRTNSYELVGKAGIYTGPDDTATFASYLIRIRLPDTLLFPPFYSVAMNAPYYRQTQIEPEVVQQCGQANFNGTKLASTVVPIPPLAEQRRIVAKVEQLMALVDALETQLAASRATAANLLSALVAELTGTSNNGKVSVPSASVTGRRGRPPKP